MSWTIAVDDFRTFLVVERNLSPNTARAYLSDVRQFAAYMCPSAADTAEEAPREGEAAAVSARASRQKGKFVPEPRMSLGAVSSLDVRGWLSTLHDSHSPTSQGRKLASIRAFFRFLQREGVVERDPTDGLPAPKTPRRPPRPLPVDDCHVLVTTKKKDAGERPDRAKPRLRALRDRALVELLYGTGMRVGELVALDVRDVELGQAQVRVMGKGRKERVIPIPRLCLEALTSWLDARRRPGILAEPLFTSLRVDRNGDPRRLGDRDVRRILRARARDAGLADRVHPHRLRHSYATHLLDMGADLREIQELLGHTSLSTTQKYTAVSIEQLREVHAAAHPRADDTGGRRSRRHGRARR